MTERNPWLDLWPEDRPAKFSIAVDDPRLEQISELVAQCLGAGVDAQVFEGLAKRVLEDGFDAAELIDRHRRIQAALLDAREDRLRLIRRKAAQAKAEARAIREARR